MRVDTNGNTELRKAPAGALRILSRQEGSQVLILAGQDREVGVGERLAHISWYPSEAIAVELAKRCSQFLIDARFRPDGDGWHDYGEAHLQTLVDVARNHLNVADRQSRLAGDRQRWTGERIARLGFLAGLGWTAKKIADDPLIRSTPNNVYRQAARFGIALSDGPQGHVSVRLPVANMAVVDRAAAAAGLMRDAYLRRWMIAATAEPERYGLAPAAMAAA